MSGSAFDGKKQLLEAIRQRFPNGTISIASHVQNGDVSKYWQYLLEDYRSAYGDGARIGYISNHIGLQDIPVSNYWFLGNSVTKTFIFHNSVSIIVTLL